MTLSMSCANSPGRRPGQQLQTFDARPVTVVCKRRSTETAAIHAKQHITSDYSLQERLPFLSCVKWSQHYSAVLFITQTLCQHTAATVSQNNYKGVCHAAINNKMAVQMTVQHFIKLHV